MTPECSNCGRHVSADYARVMAVDDEVRACPAEDCAGHHITDPRVLGGGERMISESVTQSQRIGGGR